MSANAPAVTTGAGGAQPPELGLRAAFQEPADRFEASNAEATALIEQAEAALAEAPRWRLGRTPLWTARLSLRMQWLARLLVLALTFGRIRLDSPEPGTDPTRWTLRQQLVLARLPSLRREIRAIRRRRRPIQRSALTREWWGLVRLRLALWWSPRAIRYRLGILGLQLQIVIVWLWVNREAILFYGMIVVIVGLLFLLIALIQQYQGAILDFVDSVRPSVPRSFFPADEPFFPGGDGGP